MDKRTYSCLVITFIIKISMATFCIIRNDDNCFYTVYCDDPARINIVPYCSTTDPYITLVINESSVHNITANYFNTKFDAYVNILTAVFNKWDTVQNYAFSNFKNVVYMDLSQSQIKSLGMAFIGLEQLNSLNLSRNYLEVIKPEVFMLSKNKNRLSLLDLSYNLLTYLPDDLFVNIYNLRMLYLQGNKLTMIGDQFSVNLKYLNYLNLCCSNFTTLNITWKYFTNLKELDLSFNKFNTIDDFDVKSLEMISLSHNSFEKVKYINFEQFPYLKQLDLSYNRLKEIPHSIRPQNPTGTKSLIKIYLNNNNISHIDATVFINFNYIHILNLNNNRIREIRNGTFRHVKILKKLTVSNCGLKLTNETFSGLDKTKFIDISHNNLTSLNPQIFMTCKDIRKIVADFNYIRSVDVHMFNKLIPSLNKINVKGNPMDLMDPTTTTKIGLLMQVVVDYGDLITEILCAAILVILFLLLGAMVILMCVRVRKRFTHTRL